MTFWIEEYTEKGPRVRSIGSGLDLVELATCEALGDDAITGDEALRRRLDVLSQIVGNLVDEVARNNLHKLELTGLYGYNVVPAPEG